MYSRNNFDISEKIKILFYKYIKMYDISYPGIVSWTKSVMEKLGYMVIAHNNGHSDATESYKECIKRLIEAIEENMKLKEISKERLDDYQKMHRNLKVLLKHCEKDFNKNNKKSNKNK